MQSPRQSKSTCTSAELSSPELKRAAAVAQRRHRAENQHFCFTKARDLKPLSISFAQSCLCLKHFPSCPRPLGPTKEGHLLLQLQAHNAAADLAEFDGLPCVDGAAFERERKSERFRWGWRVGHNVLIQAASSVKSHTNSHLGWLCTFSGRRI